MSKPTIAETHFAKLIAMWHGQKVIYVRPGGEKITVAASRGYSSGWSWELDRYADNHWEEYLPAARAVIEQR